MASVMKKPMSSNQARPSSSSAKGNNVAPILKRKIETSSRQQPVDTKNKSIPPKVVKSQDKGKAIAPRTPVKKREKKVYSLAGQKHDPPQEPLRIFYESLSKQIPTSEMAEFWLMEHGMLSPEKAKKAYEKKLRKAKQIRNGTPIKALPPPGRPESSNRQKLTSKPVDTKAKRRIVEDDYDEVIPSSKLRKE